MHNSRKSGVFILATSPSWLRQGSAKPSFGGSSPPVASRILKNQGFITKFVIIVLYGTISAFQTSLAKLKAKTGGYRIVAIMYPCQG